MNSLLDWVYFGAPMCGAGAAPAAEINYTMVGRVSDKILRSGRRRERLGTLAQDREIPPVTEHPAAFTAGDLLDNTKAL